MAAPMTYAIHIDAAAEAEFRKLGLDRPVNFRRAARMQRVCRLSKYACRAYHGPRFGFYGGSK